MATATAPAEGTRKRTPSPFTPSIRATISVHTKANGAASVDAIGQDLQSLFSDDYAVRIVTRARKSGISKRTGLPFTGKGPASVMVYVAPKGYVFPSQTSRGVRLDVETADLLRKVASSMGLDPNDSASIIAVAKALAEKASA